VLTEFLGDGYPVDVLTPRLQIPHPAKYGLVLVEGAIPQL
jgi:hypothetical protein